MFFLALVTACCCILGTPFFAHSSEVALMVQRLPNLEQQVEQGKRLYEAGQLAAAVTAWQQALKAYQAQGDKRNQALVLNYLALTYQQLGQGEEATQAISNSLNYITKDDPLLLAQVLNTQGQLYLLQGKAELALTAWQNATNAYTQADDDAGIIGSLINQAQALQTLGNYRQAEKTLTQVAEQLQSQPDSLLKAMGLRSLGNTLRLMGNLDQSKTILQQSLTIAEQLRSPFDISAALLSLGNTLRSTLTDASLQAALDYYQQAATASTSPLIRTQAQLNQFSLLLETNQLRAALALASQLQPQLTSLSPSRAAVYAQINFAQSLIKLKQTDTANTVSWTEIGQMLAQAVQLAQNINDPRATSYALGHLGGLYELSSQLGNAQQLTENALLLAQSINASDISYRWQWQLGRLQKAQGNSQNAIKSYSEAVKTLQFLRRDLVALNPEIQFTFRDEVEPIYRQFVDLLLQAEGTKNEPSQDNLVQARAVIESLQQAELENFFRVACLEGKLVQVDQVIDRDDATAAVIYPIILPDRLEVILKLPQQPLRHYRTVVTQGEIEKTLEELRQKLTKPYTLLQTKALSKSIYDWLIQPAEAELESQPIKTLVFVLDGALRNIPMASLYDGQHYLIEKYGIALTPGLQLIDPQPLRRGDLKALVAGLSEPRHGFERLNFVEREIAQIQSEVPSEIILNQEFTKTAFQNDLNAFPFPVVHLATHGQFSSNAEETFILAWDEPIQVNELSTLLRSRDETRPTAIELLILSACQTAVGDKRAALGLAGIAVRAGARSTLASLWNLDDETSALLMSQFYEQLKDTTVTKAQALRIAQLTLLQQPNYQHPRYWAPFVLVGNWL